MSTASPQLSSLPAYLRQQLATAEDYGYFGPGSVIWRLNQEAVLGLGIGRALLLQLAHPWVAQAVWDHSRFREHPLDRLGATVMAGELMVFGSRSQADAMAARIRTIHSHIHGTLGEDTGRWRRGTVYRADDPDALLWVLVTVVDTAFTVYEHCFGPLPDDSARSYIADAARLGTMLEIPGDMMPPDRQALQAYMRAMVADGTIAVGRIARELAHDVLYPRLPVDVRILFSPYSTASRGVTIRLLPEEIRAQYGRVATLRREPLYRAAGALGRTLLQRMPPDLRADPIASVAVKRAQRELRPAGQ